MFTENESFLQYNSLAATLAFAAMKAKAVAENSPNAPVSERITVVSGTKTLLSAQEQEAA